MSKTIETINLKKGNLYKDGLGFFIIVDICTKDKPLDESYKYLHCKTCYRKNNSFYENVTMYLIYSFKENMLNTHYSCSSEESIIMSSLFYKRVSFIRKK
ncbi:hypothetical protein M0R19_03845 [Candidatus Pacearchaeota archaeon]|nr:hypothetical protein [Candidatus Pacearchaeota archaeon]